MNGWKVVPVEPDQSMCQQGQWRAQESCRYPLRIVPIYQAMLSAAPRPPVVLPPLPPHPEHVYVWTDDEKRVIEAYARAALAQYGIKEQSDVER